MTLYQIGIMKKDVWENTTREYFLDCPNVVKKAANVIEGIYSVLEEMTIAQAESES